MNRYPMLLLCVLLIFLTGCGKNTAKISAAELEPAVAVQRQPAAPSSMTEDMLLDMFWGYAYADPADRKVIDCVIMTESEHGILGVVQYTTDDYEGCWFDFLTKELPLTAGIDAKPIEEKTLAFQETDTVFCRLCVNSEEIHGFTITYQANEEGYSFKLCSVPDA